MDFLKGVMPIVSGISGLIPHPAAQGISAVSGAIGNVINNPTNPSMNLDLNTSNGQPSKMAQQMAGFIGRAGNTIQGIGNQIQGVGNQIQGATQYVAQTLQGVTAPPQGPIM
jgi:hypothetical protein